jgi:hypothetical protein
MKGAALAGMIASVVYVILFHITSYRLYPIPFKLLDWFMVFFMVSFILLISTSTIESIFAPMDVLVKIGIAIVLIVFFGLYFRKFKAYMK